MTRKDIGFILDRIHSDKSFVRKVVEQFFVSGLVGVIAISIMGYFVKRNSGPASVIDKGNDDFFSEYIPYNPEDNENPPDIKSNKINDLTFDDVCGNEEAKEEMMDIVDFLKSPEKYRKMDVKMPKGVLLYGPPGCGKTLLAKALANEAGVSFLSCESSSFEEVYVGVGPERVRKLFARAKKIAPCIIFIDEIDLLSRSEMRVDSFETTNELLTQMDGFAPLEEVIVIGSTNMPQMIDKALLRSGRFDRSVTVNLPGKKARRKILELNLKDTALSDEINLDHFAAESIIMSGADLVNVANTAKINAAKSDRDELSVSDLQDALLTVSSGLERRSVRLNETLKKRLAVSQSARAITTLLTPAFNADFKKVSIVPRGTELSFMQAVPKNESALYSQTREGMLARIDVDIAGQIGEELVFGVDGISSSSESQLRSATDLARNMVGRLGMGEKVGFAVSKPLESYGRIPDEIKSAIDADTIRLLHQEEEKVLQMLKRNRSRLEALSEMLLQKENLDRKDIEILLKTVDEDVDEDPPGDE